MINEYALLSFYDYILPRLEINPSQFSYHFVPAYTRRVTHFECVELLLKHFPTANVILINGLGTDLFRFNSTRGKTVNVNNVKKLTGFASVEEKKKLLEPSYQIQQLIKDTPNCPTFVTGFHCVGMSVTLINEHIGNFDSVLMAHEHYSRAKLYQLCRFLFNFSSWSPENRAKIKRTKFYSMTKYVADTCCEYEESVEKMCTEYAGKTCSLNEIQGKEPEQPTEREIKKAALTSIKVNNEKLWRKFKVYDGNDEEIWNKVKEFYEIIMDKKLEGKSMPKINNEGFYECSTTKHVEIQLINNIKKLEEQSWWSTFQLTQSLNYARVFVGYESLIDSSEYTIFVKYVELEDSDKTREVLTKYGK